MGFGFFISGMILCGINKTSHQISRVFAFVVGPVLTLIALINSVLIVSNNSILVISILVFVFLYMSVMIGIYLVSI